jgi:hypothetical protein
MAHHSMMIVQGVADTLMDAAHVAAKKQNEWLKQMHEENDTFEVLAVNTNYRDENGTIMFVILTTYKTPAAGKTLEGWLEYLDYLEYLV